MAQARFMNQAVEGPMTIMEYARVNHHTLFTRLEEAWNLLGGSISETSTEEELSARAKKIAMYDKYGVQVQSKSFKSNLAYKERAPDTLSKMLDMLKPCGAIDIHIDARIIYMSFNETLVPAREQVIRGKWLKIVQASQTSGIEKISKKLEVLSEILYMQEYKIVDKYFEFIDSINVEIDNKQIAISDTILFTKLLSIFDKYYNLIIKYRDNFNKTTDELPRHIALFESVEHLIASSGAQMPEVLLSPCVNRSELSVCFLKMRALFPHLISLIPDEYIEVKDTLLSKYEEFDKSFYKALDDVCKITKYLATIQNLENFEIVFIENPHKIHAELVMFEHHVKAIEPNPEFLPRQLFENLGVSKLACVQCHITYDFAGFAHNVRGSHGILFVQQWNFPQHWIVENDGRSLLEHLVEHIETLARTRYIEPIDPTLVDHNSHSAPMSDDDERDQVADKHMRVIKYNQINPNILGIFFTIDEVDDSARVFVDLSVNVVRSSGSGPDSGMGASPNSLRQDTPISAVFSHVEEAAELEVYNPSFDMDVIGFDSQNLACSIWCVII